MKNRNNRLTSFIAVMLCVIMTVLTFTGCGKSGGGETSKKEFVYVPEYVQVEFEVNYIDTAVSIGDTIYLCGNSWNEDTGESKYYLYKYNAADGKVDTLSVEMGENDSLGRMAATPDGNLALIVFSSDYETDENGEITDYSQTMELRVISGEDGAVISY